MGTQGEATLIVRLIDGVTAPIRGVVGVLDKLQKHWLSIASAVGAYVGVIKASLNAYAEQESAVNKLEIALRNQGIASKGVTQGLLDQAEALQKTTAFSDDAVIEMQALLVTFGLSGKALRDTTKAALDLSSGLGIDLRTATMMLGKAAQGETGTLSKLGLKFSENTTHAEKFESALAQVNKRFGGSAEAQAKTYAGQIDQLKNRFNELQEQVGRFLLPVAQRWSEWLGKAIDGTLNLMTVKSAEKSVNQIALEQLRARSASLRDSIQLAKDEGNARGTNYEKAVQEYAANARLINQLEQWIAVKKKNKEVDAQVKEPIGIPPPIPEVVETERYKQEEVARKILELQGFHVEVEAMEIEHQARLLEIQNRTAEANRLRDAFYHKQKIDAVKQTLENIATFSNAKNKQLAIAGKAAAAASAIINTAQAITVALKSAPPPFNFALAATVGAMGAAQVATIAGTPLAAGGVILPTVGGTLATIGEGGRSEAVIPLGDERAKRQIQDTLGGGDVVINLNVAEGGVFVGDQRGVQELARLVDEELFRSGRNRKSVFKD